MRVSRGSRGQSTVELALALPLLTLVIFGTYPASVTILGLTLYSGNLTTKRTVRVLN